MSVVYPIDIAIVAIMKNEGDYIREWLEYHILLGIRKFFLYDNGSTDMTRVLIQPYVKSGMVEYIFWPGKAQQLRVYNDALEKHRLDCRFLGFIDIDEFVFQTGKIDLLTLLNGLFTDYQVAAVGINWRMYGSSFWETKPVGGVLKNFVYRAADSYEHNEHIKSFVNPRRCWYMRNAHYGVHFAWGKTVNWQGQKVPAERIASSSDAPFYVNHYFTKSKEEWIKRRALGKADVNEKRPLTEFYWEGLNDIYDDGIVHLQSRLKHEMRIKSDVMCPWTERLSKAVDYIIEVKQGTKPLLENILLEWYSCRQNLRVDEEEAVDDIFQGLLMNYLYGDIYAYEQDLLVRVLNRLPLREKVCVRIVEWLISMLEVRYSENFDDHGYKDYIARTLKALQAYRAGSEHKDSRSR